MSGRWLDQKSAAEYMDCSLATVKRHLDAGVLSWHVTPTGFKRLDREQIDAMFTVPERPSETRGVVTAEDERRYIRRKATNRVNS